MAEQGRSQADASGGNPSQPEGAGDVSMDEILTSLRSILEEEPKAESQGDKGQASSGEPDAEADFDPEGSPGEEPEEELLLTDVVEPGPNAPANGPDTAPEEAGPDPEETAEAPAAETTAETAEPAPRTEDEQLDALFGQWSWETEESSEPPAEGPNTAGIETEASTEIPGGPGTESEPSGAEESPLSFEPEGTPDPDRTPVPGTGGDALGEPEPEPAGARTGSQPTAEVTEFPATASPSTPAVDDETLKGEVEHTVQEQVARATADLDTRLAEALEPKIRQALQGFLEDRLPSLLQELAEAEIERIKRGE
jgi:cell pole-organizing protein PopZ